MNMAVLKAQQFAFRFAHKFSGAEFEVALIGSSKRGAEHAAKAQIARLNRVAAYKLELVTCEVKIVEVDRQAFLGDEQALSQVREVWHGLLERKPLPLEPKPASSRRVPFTPNKTCACGLACSSELCGVLTRDDVRRSHIVQIWEEASKLPAVSVSPIAPFWEDRRDGVFYGGTPHQAYRMRNEHGLHEL
jgi:hypothetical protein